MKLRLANTIVHEFDNKIVFTTNDRSQAALLQHICEDSNTTETSHEFHFQGWVDRYQLTRLMSKSKR